MTWTQLHDACENRHFDDVVKLAGVHPEQGLGVDDHGLTPLHILCWGNPEPLAVQALLDTCPQAASDRDVHGDTPLHIACACPQTDQQVVHLLLDACPSAISNVNREGLMPLHMACRHAPQNESVIGLLVQKHPYALRSHIKMGSPPPGSHKQSPLAGKPTDHALIDPRGGIGSKTFSSLRYELTSQQVRDGAYPLHMAVQARAPVGVLELLMDGAEDVLLRANKFGDTPLHVALAHQCDGASEAAVQALLQRSPPAVARLRNQRGELPLHVAVRTGCSVRTVADLLQLWPESIRERHGVDSLSPVELAVRHGKCSDEVVRLLTSALEDSTNDQVD